MTKSFEKWQFEEVENTFGLQQVKNLPELTDWLTVNEPISSLEQATLQNYQNLLRTKAEIWNEEELKMFFIELE